MSHLDKIERKITRVIDQRDPAVQDEPSEGSDPTTLDLFASIGIVKGKPFNPTSG